MAIEILGQEDQVVRMINCRSDRPPPLSDAELVKMRAMFVAFDNIMDICPIAQRAQIGEG